MTEAEMDAIIKTDAGGEITYRDRRIFLAAVEWAAAKCQKMDAEPSFLASQILRQEVAQLG